MANMINCKGCGKKISKKAKACPNCGEPVPKTSLLDWLLLIILIPILFYNIQSIGTVENLTEVTNQSIIPKTNSHKKDAVTKKQKLIPRSYPEKCNYYLVNSKVKNAIKRVVSKQVCPKNKYYSGISFSLTDINCKSRKYKDLGYAEDSISNIKRYPSSKWTSLIKGSSKSDLVNFVCK